MKKLKCISFHEGLDIIEVESTFTRGLPNLSIVGLASTAIKESVERIKATLLSCDFAFPAKKSLSILVLQASQKRDRILIWLSLY